MALVKRINVSQDLGICKDFSEKVSKTQQEIEFGNHKTAARSHREIRRDTLIGKLAEVAVKKFLESKNIETKLDFGIYPRGKWDDSDIVINNKRIDIKASRRGARYLLVEDNKLKFRKKENKLPHSFIFAITDWNRQTDEPTGEVYLVGYYLLGDLISNADFIKSGNFIPGTRAKLQANNYVLHAEKLKRDWDNYIKCLKENTLGVSQ